MEGWKEGWEEFYEKQYISAVRKQGSVISEYLVRNRWLSKAEAVILAGHGRLHAVVVHTKKGTYLRPEFHAKAFRDLVR